VDFRWENKLKMAHGIPFITDVNIAIDFCFPQPPEVVESRNMRIFPGLKPAKAMSSGAEIAPGKLCLSVATKRFELATNMSDS
jgi:hypothetical protein